MRKEKVERQTRTIDSDVGKSMSARPDVRFELKKIMGCVWLTICGSTGIIRWHRNRNQSTTKTHLYLNTTHPNTRTHTQTHARDKRMFINMQRAEKHSIHFGARIRVERGRRRQSRTNRHKTRVTHTRRHTKCLRGTLYKSRERRRRSGSGTNKQTRPDKYDKLSLVFQP